SRCFDLPRNCARCVSGRPQSRGGCRSIGISNDSKSSWLNTRGGRLRILLVGDYPRDARLGSTKVLLKLQEELRGLGHTCDVLLADDLGASPRHRWLRWGLEPIAALAAVRRIFLRNGPYDVVDIASAEGLWVGLLRR